MRSGSGALSTTGTSLTVLRRTRAGFLMLRHCFSDARLRHPMGFTDLRICPNFLPISVFIKLIFTSKHIQHYKLSFFITDFS